MPSFVQSLKRYQEKVDDDSDIFENEDDILALLDDIPGEKKKREELRFELEEALRKRGTHGVVTKLEEIINREEKLIARTFESKSSGVEDVLGDYPLYVALQFHHSELEDTRDRKASLRRKINAIPWKGAKQLAIQKSLLKRAKTGKKEKLLSKLRSIIKREEALATSSIKELNKQRAQLTTQRRRKVLIFKTVAVLTFLGVAGGILRSLGLADYATLKRIIEGYFSSDKLYKNVNLLPGYTTTPRLDKPIIANNQPSSTIPPLTLKEWTGDGLLAYFNPKTEMEKTHPPLTQEVWTDKNLHAFNEVEKTRAVKVEETRVKNKEFYHRFLPILGMQDDAEGRNCSVFYIESVGNAIGKWVQKHSRDNQEANTFEHLLWWHGHITYIVRALGPPMVSTESDDQVKKKCPAHQMQVSHKLLRERYEKLLNLQKGYTKEDVKTAATQLKTEMAGVGEKIVPVVGIKNITGNITSAIDAIEGILISLKK